MLGERLIEQEPFSSLIARTVAVFDFLRESCEAIQRVIVRLLTQASLHFDGPPA
jgi:hypothetical protein